MELALLRSAKKDETLLRRFLSHIRDHQPVNFG